MEVISNKSNSTFGNFMSIVFDKKNIIYIICFTVLVAYCIQALSGNFVFNIFSDRDMLRSFDILNSHLSSSAEMSFSSTGIQNPGSMEYYIIKFFMLFFESVEWIMFCIYLLYVISVFYLYKTTMLVTKDNIFVSLIISVIYILSDIVLNNFLFIWNPAFVPFFAVISLYFLAQASVSSTDNNFIIKLFFSSLFAFLCIQMHVSTVILMVVILTFIILSKISFKTKLKSMMSICVAMLFAYSTYIIGYKDSAVSYHNSLFSYGFISLIFILIVYVFIGSLMSFLNRKTLLSASLSFMSFLFILFAFLSVLQFKTCDIGYDCDIEELHASAYDYKDIPLSYKLSIANQLLDQNVNRAIKFNISFVNYIDNKDKSYLLPVMHIFIFNDKGDIKISITNNGYFNSDWIGVFNSKFSNLKSQNMYIFMLFYLIFCWFYFIFIKKPDVFVFSLVITGSLFSFFMLFSFINMFESRYAFIPFISMLISFSYLIKGVRCSNKYLYIAPVILVAVFSVDKLSHSTFGSYHDIKLIKKYIEDENESFNRAAIFKISNGLLYRLRISEGMSFSYLDRNNTKKKDFNGKGLCYAISFDKTIKVKELLSFYKRRIDFNASITSISKDKVGNAYILKYKTNSLKCFTNFENKYIETYGDSLIESKNTIVEKYDFLAFKLFFEEDGVTLFSRELRGLGYDYEKNKNNQMNYLKISLVSEDGKVYNKTLINREIVGVLGLNTPLKFNFIIPNGTYKYTIDIQSLTNKGINDLANSIDILLRDKMKDSMFFKSGFAGSIIIDN